MANAGDEPWEAHPSDTLRLLGSSMDRIIVSLDDLLRTHEVVDPNNRCGLDVASVTRQISEWREARAQTATAHEQAMEAALKALQDPFAEEDPHVAP